MVILSYYLWNGQIEIGALKGLVCAQRPPGEEGNSVAALVDRSFFSSHHSDVYVAPPNIILIIL